MAQAHQLLGLGIAGHPGNYVGDDSIDMSYEGLLALSERIGTVGRRGTQKSVIDRLPTSTYGDATLGTTDKDARCPICFEDYTAADVVKTLPCTHVYHSECITQWLNDNAACPICRLDVSRPDTK